MSFKFLALAQTDDDISPLLFSEVELWMIFHCLARALLVMHSGSEDIRTANRWDKKEICHFDLKPQNGISA